MNLLVQPLLLSIAQRLRGLHFPGITCLDRCARYALSPMLSWSGLTAMGLYLFSTAGRARVA
jgi:hypothetical protein